MAVVTLLSDFVDGTCMALSEDTDAENLNAYMTASPGQLWAGVQQRRLARQLTRERRGPGTLYFAPTEAHDFAWNLVEAPGTAPGSEWLIATVIYRHSRAMPTQ